MSLLILYSNNEIKYYSFNLVLTATNSTFLVIQEIIKCLPYDQSTYKNSATIQDRDIRLKCSSFINQDIFVLNTSQYLVCVRRKIKSYQLRSHEKVYVRKINL